MKETMAGNVHNTVDERNPTNDLGCISKVGINHLSSGEGFLPSTVFQILAYLLLAHLFFSGGGLILMFQPIHSGWDLWK